MKSLILIVALFSITVSCSKFQAKRVDAKESDSKAMEITDNWVSGDTNQVVQEIIKNIRNHNGLKKYLSSYQGQPKVFIGEVQNQTADAYFPIDDINNELLFELSNAGDFILVDAKAREALLKEIKYQNDGMVDPKAAKMVGKQSGADLMIFGSVFMKPEMRDGKTIKEYSVNVYMTDIEKGTEVLRTRSKLFKYSNQKATGW